MLAKLESSGPIDRDGSGEIPDACSTFQRVAPIPRGPARQVSFGTTRFSSGFAYHGGAPRCPQCLKSTFVDFNGRNLARQDREAWIGFHCNRCRVWWRDTTVVLCFICENAFTGELEPRPGVYSTLAYPDAPPLRHASCYHINAIKHPFCPACERMIGADSRHSRRQLRRMVGLRK